MTALSPGERSKLAKILAMLGSDHAGERASAGLLATRILRSAGTSWEDLLKPAACCSANSPSARAPVPMTDLGLCIRNLQQLTEWEQNFTLSLRGRVLLTQAQRHKLFQIASKLRRAGVA